MTLRIASAEIAGIFFMIIILGSLRNKAEGEEAEHKIFYAFTLSTTLGLLVDALSYIADDKGANAALLMIINILAFSVIYFGLSLFSIYLMMVIRHTKVVSDRPIYPLLVFSVLNILWIILGVCNGRFFAIRDRHLTYGPWSEIITIMPIFGFLYILLVLVINIRNLGKRMILVLGSFVVFPLIAAVLFFCRQGLELAYLSMALSAAVIFTYVKREEIDEVHLRERIMCEISATDTLTGLVNRRGFNDAIEQTENHQSLGTVFCDLNALKKINDHQGHRAGDAYLQRFADILREVFGDRGTLCRISGDEFVVLLYDISQEEFDRLREELAHAIRRNDRIASVGYAYGESLSVTELLNSAEREMYEDKNRYYRETGQDRRRT